MIIERVRAKNYKTYQELDLDLSVRPDRPIILVGGHNGDGKTTLFEAIYGGLYGLAVQDRAKFRELVNVNVQNDADAEIMLEVTFTGQVLNQTQKYVLRRTYQLQADGRPVGSVMLNMNGTVFRYGSATPEKEAAQSQSQVEKIINANLPNKLSRYFLFDAMQSSDLLKENVFAQIIRDNIENVMGFRKYVELRQATERLLQERASERIKIEGQKKEYEGLCAELNAAKDEFARNKAEQEKLVEWLALAKAEYDAAKVGAKDYEAAKSKIAAIDAQIAETGKAAARYSDEVREFVDGMETSVFIPNVAALIDLEVKKIAAARKGGANGVRTLSEAEINAVVGKVMEYLRERNAVTDAITAAEVSAAVARLREEDEKKRPFAFLSDADVGVLTGLKDRGTPNPFPRLAAERQSLEARIGELDGLRIQRGTLERHLTEGDDAVIRDYEKKSGELKLLEDKASELVRKIAGLEKKIHQIDVIIQREPDVKFDTLAKLPTFFKEVADSLLKRKRRQIESEMQELLNKLILPYKDHIARVELSEELEDFSIKLYHTAGNEISLNQLNAASKQIFIQILLRVLRNLGDYNPPVMIDTVMGVLDNESRGAMMEEYFPNLAEQTILLCTTSEIRIDSDYRQLSAWIAKTYTLKRDVENQRTEVAPGYFGVELEEED